MKTRTVMLDDLGDLGAPPGSRPWALAVRVELTSALRNVQSSSEHIQWFVDGFRKHDAHKQLTGKDGKPFCSYEAFCCAPDPWGLGYSQEAIDRIISDRKDAERERRARQTAIDNPMPLFAHGGERKAVETAKAAEQNGGTGEQPSKDRNEKVAAYGTTASYRVRKLRRDFPEIAERLEAGEFKSVAAAERVAVGQEANPPRKVATTLDQLRRAWANATVEEREIVLRENAQGDDEEPAGR